MELGTLGAVGSVFVLVYALWIWWRDGRTWQPFYRRTSHRIRSALGVVSREELSLVQEHFLEKKQQWETRIAQLEAITKFSNQQQYASKEIEQRLAKLELADDHAKSSEAGPVQQSRSLVRFGVLVTISDGLWTHLGTECANEIETHFIESMIQGPFCPVCLKRLAGRDRSAHAAEVPTECRHCGASWSDQGTQGFPRSSVELKRQVYAQLDQEYRAGEIRKPSD